MKTTYERILKVAERNEGFPTKQITCSDDAVSFARQFYSDDIELYESFFLLMMNTQNNTIGYAKISQGGVAGTTVDVKIICKYAVDTLANSVMIFHNHPSGNIKPSEQDKNMTEKINQSLKLFDCKLLDHIILTKNSCFSFTDEGLL